MGVGPSELTAVGSSSSCVDTVLGAGGCQSGSSSFICASSDAPARAAALKWARLCATEELEDLVFERVECSDGSDPDPLDDTSAGESLLDAVLGLSTRGEYINLFARMGFPAACRMARAVTSSKTDEEIEDVWDGDLLN